MGIVAQDEKALAVHQGGRFPGTALAGDENVTVSHQVQVLESSVPPDEFVGQVIIVFPQVLFNPLDFIREEEELDMFISFPNVPNGFAEIVYGHSAIKGVIHFGKIPAPDMNRACRARPRFHSRELICRDSVLKREITTENIPIGILVIKEIIAGKIAWRRDGQREMHSVPLGGKHPGIESHPGGRRNFHGQFRPQFPELENPGMDPIVVLSVPGIPSDVITDPETLFCIIPAQQILVHLRTDSAIDIDDDIGLEQAQTAAYFVQSRRYTVFIQQLAFDNMQDMANGLYKTHCPKYICSGVRVLPVNHR